MTFALDFPRGKGSAIWPRQAVGGARYALRGCTEKHSLAGIRGETLPPLVWARAWRGAAPAELSAQTRASERECGRGPGAVNRGPTHPGGSGICRLISR